MLEFSYIDQRVARPIIFAISGWLIHHALIIYYDLLLQKLIKLRFLDIDCTHFTVFKRK